MNDLHVLTYWATIGFVIFGGILGLISVWVDNFFDNKWSWKLFMTDVIMACSSVIVAAITKWLG